MMRYSVCNITAIPRLLADRGYLEMCAYVYVCMYVYMCMYVCLCVCVCVRPCMCVCVLVRERVRERERERGGGAALVIRTKVNRQGSVVRGEGEGEESTGWLRTVCRVRLSRYLAGTA